MFFGRWTSWRAANNSRVLSRFTLCPLSLVISAGLLTGCGDAGSPLADYEPTEDYEPAEAWTQSQAEVTLVELRSAIDSQEVQNPYWSFTNDNENDEAQTPPALIRLPAVEEVAPVEEFIAALSELDKAELNKAEPDEASPEEAPLARLLPPQPIVIEQAETEQSETPAPLLAYLSNDLTEISAETLPLVETSPLPVLAELSEQEQQLAALLQGATSATTGALTDGRVNELAKTKIQQAYAMANRGALYVARQELIEVLRMISQAKDAQQGTPERTVALAAGIRALREAEDFAPRGTQLEAELDITVLCASHRTPVAKQAKFANLVPRLMMDRYLRYAQLQLAMSVAGEPAGSMALHALGKLNSQLGRVEPTKHHLAQRHAIAYQQAALLAHNQNHLAAHELGILLATSGHFSEAQQLLLQVAAREPNAIVFRNLARVQEKLGQPGPALANRDLARQLSQQGATGTNNIQWVSPDQFAQGGFPAPRYTTTQRTTTQHTMARRPNANSVVIPGSRPVAPQTLRR